MTRAIRSLLVSSLVLVPLAGCGISSYFSQREAWRHEAEVDCLKSGTVREGPGVTLLSPIAGPGICGAEFPFKIRALGNSDGSSALGYTDDDSSSPTGSVRRDKKRARPPESTSSQPARHRDRTADDLDPPPAKKQREKTEKATAKASPSTKSAPAKAEKAAAKEYVRAKSRSAKARKATAKGAPPTNLASPKVIKATSDHGSAKPSSVAKTATRSDKTNAPLTSGSITAKVLPPLDIGPQSSKQAPSAAVGVAPLLTAPATIQPSSASPASRGPGDAEDRSSRYPPDFPLGGERVPVAPAPEPPRTLTAAVTPAATLACPVVSALDRWVVESVQPAAQRWFGQPVVEIKQISAYSCRGMNGNPRARISEHAFGNALDIAAFVLVDGQVVTVRQGWRGTPEEQGFLHDVQFGACAMFTTVLAPGSNRFHYDHIHVDLMRRNSGRSICQPQAVPGEVVAGRARERRGYASHRLGDGPTGALGSGRRKARSSARLPDARFEDDRDGPAAVPGED